jgi:hypothetical protein
VEVTHLHKQNGSHTKSALITPKIAWRLEVAAIQTKSAFADSKQKGLANQDLVSANNRIEIQA